MEKSRLPFLAETESVNENELQVLKLKYEREGEDATSQTLFDLSWALIRSKHRKDQEEGARLLNDIYEKDEF